MTETILNTELERRTSILNGTDGTIQIESVDTLDPKWHEGYAIESIGVGQVTRFDSIIEEQAASVGVSSDWLRAIMYLENSQGLIPDAIQSPVTIFTGESTILPMNINPDLWGGIGGVSAEAISTTAEGNIRAGAFLVKGIVDRLAPEDQNFTNVATLWNGLGNNEAIDFGARAQNIYENRLWENPSDYQYRTFIEDVEIHHPFALDTVETVASVLGKLALETIWPLASITNSVGNVATVLLELIPEINLVGAENYSSVNGIANTSSLQNLTGMQVEVLLGISGNEKWQSNFIRTSDGSEYFIYEDVMVFRTTNGVKFEYQVISLNDVVFNSNSGHVQGTADNSYLDFETDFSGGATDTSTENGTADFENGTAVDGGNYDANMPLDVINGDGASKTIPSAIVTDDYRPGNIEISYTDGYLERTMDLSNAISIANFNSQPSLPGSYLDIRYESKYVSVIGSSISLKNVDPLILDMDNDGIELINFDDSLAFFDVDNDGVIENTGWVSSDDAILVHDVNGDGIINDITETISEYYLAAPGTGAVYEDGLQALATLDFNADGVFDASDNDWGTLRVWQDADEDAVTDDGELKTLDELGITSIDLNREVVSREEIEGNPILSRSIMMINGVEHIVASVDFATNPIGYEWNDIAEGVQIKTEDGSTSTLVIEESEGGTIDLSLINGDGDSANDTDSVIGNVGDDVIIGDDGNNWLLGGAGSDTLQGGLGNDTITIDAEDDLANVDAGEGFDIVMVSGNVGVTINMNDINAEVVVGGLGNDIIISGSTSNVFVRGGAGNDVIIGGSADDALSGEDGDDTIDGGLGDDILRGHRGEDLLIGNDGEDLLDGGLGDDTLYGDSGEDLLKGGAGNDTLYGGADYDVAEFSGKISEYAVTALGNGQIQVVDKVEGRDGTDILNDIEALNFQDIQEVSVNLQNPFTANDILAISGSGPYTLLASDILANEIDYQGDALHLTSVSDVVGGTAILDGNGDVVFTPDETYTGVMSFKYQIADSQGNTGATAVLKATGATAEVKGTVYLQTDEHPNDPLFYDQWYLNDANILPVWKDYTGKDINVGVFEIGTIDFDHPDLVDNLSQDTIDYSNEENIGGHATLVAGVIGASNNGMGSVGVAYDATLSGISFESETNPDFSLLLDFQNYDVVNNSWGYSGPFVEQLESDNAFEVAAAFGRDGLGTAIVFAAGNERQSGDSANAHNFYNNKYTIAVGAINKNADLSSLEIQQDPFSNPGSNILISGPGSNITSTSVLLENSNGSTFGSDHEVTQGTSFATPLVSGIVALMLEANPNLGYRDIQEILAYSARMVDDQNTVWQTNGASDWNGGGLHFSHDYGFGNVDALAAVRLAETWGRQQTYSNELNVVTDGNLSNAAIPDGGTLTDTVNIALTESFTAEHVTVTIDFDHSRVGDLIFKLVSPNGTEGILLNRLGVDPGSTTDTGHGAETLTFDFGNVSAWGEDVNGDWTLTVQDALTGETGTINSWSLEISGKYAEYDDIYVYTDEFSTLTDTDRLALSDSDGDDTINTSAISSDTILDLNAGNTSTIDGKNVVISSGTVIERAISGDGNDTLTGNTSNNFLFGGRGNDTLSGGDGNDYLFGAWGVDDLTGGAGKDRFFVRADDTGSNIIQDFSLNDDFITLVGFTDASSFYDFNVSIIGSDTQLEFDNGQTLLLKNVDYFDLEDKHFEFVDEFNFHDVKMNIQEFYLSDSDTEGDYFFTPKDANGNGIIDSTPLRIYGLAGDDTIFGNAGDDEIYGGEGNDLLVGSFDSNDVDGGSDKLYGENGDDVLDGSGNDDYLYGGNGNDTLTGRGGADTLWGGHGHNDLHGDDGNDIIHLEYGLNEVWGNGGIDKYIVHKGPADSFFNIGGVQPFNDIIYDFDVVNEHIDITEFTNAVSFGDLNFQSVNISGTLYTQVYLDGQQHITLQNVSQSDLSADNFIFHENAAPDAMSDVLTASEDTPLFFLSSQILANDTDLEDGVPALTKIVTDPKHGVLGLDGNGVFTYIPEEDYYGSDSFVYEVSDSHGETVTGLVTINVQSVNDAPDAITDNFTVLEDQTFSGNVLLNDSDSDGDVFNAVAEVVTSAQGVSISIASDGSFDYTPLSDFYGSDSFTYTVMDSLGNQSTGTVNLNVLNVNDAPIAQDDMIDAKVNATTTANVLDYNNNGADYDIEGDALSVDAETITSAQGGTVVISANGNFDYTPATDYVGDDSFTYTLRDAGGLINTGTVNLLVSTLVATSATESFIGHVGEDTVDYSNSDVGVVVNLATNAAANGYAANDTFSSIENIIGSDYSDYIVGDAANNELYGGAGDDWLEGGLGDDSYYFTSGADVIVETGGHDTVYLPVGYSENDVSFLRDVGNVATDPNSVYDLIVRVDDKTSSDPDVILGTITIKNQFVPPADNQAEDLTFRVTIDENLVSYDADLTDQRVTTFGGDSGDVIYGIDYGANPDDTIFGFDTGDIISAGAGNDTVYGGLGIDIVDGGDGIDALYGEQDGDYLYGGAGDDVIYGDVGQAPESVNYVGDDFLYGQAGNDWIEGNKGNDTIDGGADNDILLGQEGNDIIYGGDGRDYLIGDFGSDLLNGGLGMDDLYGGVGEADTFQWTEIDMTAEDNVMDFNAAEGDKLDIANILSGFDAQTSAISDFVQITEVGSNSLLKVDSDGGGDNFTTIATIYGLTGMDENDLYANNNLITVAA